MIRPNSEAAMIVMRRRNERADVDIFDKTQVICKR